MDKSEERQETRKPLREFSYDAPESRELKFSPWCWAFLHWAIPTLIIVVLSVGMLLWFHGAYEVEEQISEVEMIVNDFNLATNKEEVGRRFIAKYLAKKGGLDIFQEVLEDGSFYYSGLIIDDNERMLFEAWSNLRGEAKLRFYDQSDGITYDWNGGEFSRLETIRKDERLVSELLFLIADFVDPLYLLAASPEKFRIIDLQSVRWSGFEAWRVTINDESTEEFGWRVFLEPDKMQLLAIEKWTADGHVSNYRFDNEKEAMGLPLPHEVGIESNGVFRGTVFFQKMLPVQQVDEEEQIVFNSSLIEFKK